MLNENARKWIEDLRSGKYRQTQLTLRSAEDGGFCCLGRACDIFMKSGMGGRWVYRGDRDGEQHGIIFELNGNIYDTRLPKEVASWLQLASQDGNFQDKEISPEISALSDLNDEGWSFEDIADLIEKTPKNLFKE